MKKQLLRIILSLFVLHFITIIQLSAASGTNGTIKLTVSSEENDTTELSVSVGTDIKLTANIAKMTNGSSNGSSEYSITIPKYLIDSIGNELTTDSIIKNSASGENGNKAYDHGTYTTKKAGAYTFALNVTTGERDGKDPVVYFHPLTPNALVATDINPLGFTANWESAEGAESYTIELTGEQNDTLTVNDVTDLFYEFTNLLSSSEYSYRIKSKGDTLYSFKPSDPVSVNTLIRPVLSSNPETLLPFADFILGTEDIPTQNISVITSDLYDNISLTPGTQNVFNINKNSIDKDDENKSAVISFNPTLAGQYKDTLVISSLYAEDLRIPLTGNVIISAPQALAAGNEKSSAFTANWEKNPYAESYILTVLDENTNPLEDYNGLNVGDTTAYEVVNLLPNTVYTYTIKAVNNGVSSISSNTITVTTDDGPVITYSRISQFSQEVNTTTTKTIRIKGANLTEKINLNISGEYFSIDETELDAEGGSIVITYAPTIVGAHEATLVLSSAMAQDVVISLNGISTPLSTTILPATDMNLNSFIANWNTAANAVDYLLTVKQDENIIFEDKSSQGATSLFVSDLASGKIYTYVVKVVENNQISAASNIAETYTHSAPAPTAYPEKTAVRVKWEALPGVTNYKVNFYKDKSPILGYNQIAVVENEYFFTGLTVNGSYAFEIMSVYNEQEYSSDTIEVQTLSDYGAQLRNSGFELWDGTGTTSIEPTNWNSFMNAAGSWASTAKEQQVKDTTLIRPHSKGTKSAVIWSKSVLTSIIANGNLTSGQIQANSTSAVNADNHNKTIVGNDDFSAPFVGKPDSMTVWVKYMPIEPTDSARISAAIHDYYAYRDPSGSDPDAENHVVAKAELNYSVADVENNDWQRLSIPFEYTGNDLIPAYMLTSITTNMTPGKGSANDSVFIDDILMIYKPTLTIGQLNKSKYVLGETIKVPYTITGTMSPSNLNEETNVVYLELSDENGSFDNAQVITQLTTDNSGELTATLPDNCTLSTNYKVRIATTNYPMISDNISITITQTPVAPVATEATSITAASFVANWNIVENATGYLLFVDGKEIIIDGGEINSYDVMNLTPETEYSYTVKTIVDDLYSETSNAITIKTKDGGSILYTGNTDISSNAGVMAIETLSISGEGLIDNIYIEFVDNTTGFFSIDKNELTVDGGNVEITYNPTEIGIHTAKLRLQSTFVDNIVVTITGTTQPFIVNTFEAEDITPVSFTAKWEASTEAEAYLLTVFDSNRNILDGYNERNVGTATSYPINELTPEAIYYYTVKVLAQGLKSQTSVEEAVTTLRKPLINDELAVKQFLLNINTTETDTLIILASDLFDEGKINAQLTGSDYFTSNKQELSSGDKLIISYNPSEAGIHDAVIILSAEYADEVTINITGTARPLPVIALPATNTTLSSFVANWEISVDADAHLLTVKNNAGNTVLGYDRKNVDNTTSVEITDLQKLRNYTYYVEVLKNDIISEASNIIETRTASESGINTINIESIMLYPNPAKNRIFIEGAYDGAEYTIIDTKGILIQKGNMEGNMISIENVSSGIYIIKIGKANISFIKE